MPRRIDFFISYTRSDLPWARWVAHVLEDAGYITEYQDRDFHVPSPFIHRMQKALTEDSHMIALLSEDYFQSDYCQLEWQAVLVDDPKGEQGRLIPVRVKKCTPPGLLRQINYIDLVEIEEDEAEEHLTSSIRKVYHKRSINAPYPGSQQPQLTQQENNDQGAFDAGDVYFIHADNVLAGEWPRRPWQVDELRANIARHALFYDQLLVSDSILLNNPLLRKIFQSDQLGFQGLVQAQVFVPLLRDAVDMSSFADVARGPGRRHFTLDDGAHLASNEAVNQPGNEVHSSVADGLLQRVEFAEFIDTHCPVPRRYKVEAIANDFRETVEACLSDEELLSGCQLDHVADRLRSYINEAINSEWTMSRSHVFSFANSLSKSDQVGAHQLRVLSSVIYHGRFANSLHLNPSYPPIYANLIQRLRKFRPQIAPPEIGLQPEEMLSELDEPPFTDDIFHAVDYEFIQTVRAGTEFRDYLFHLRAWVNNQTSNAHFVHRLNRYLEFLADLMSQRKS